MTTLKQETQLTLRNRASAVHFFVARLLSIAVSTKTYARHIRNLRLMTWHHTANKITLRQCAASAY